MRITYSNKLIGAHISDFDAGNELNTETFAQVADVFYDRSVLCLKAQHLTPDQLLAFARHFGEPDVHFLEHYTLPGYPNIFLVSNIQENGRDIGFADAGRVWHSDGSYMQTPVGVSMLYAVEVPLEEDRALGSTQFASAWAAYDGLPETTKCRIDGLEAVHQVAGRRARTGTGLKDREQEKAQPDAVHPLVRVHPLGGVSRLAAVREQVERAALEQAEMEYLYNDPSGYCFMNCKTYDQVFLEENLVGTVKNFLLPNHKVQVEFYEGKSIGITMPEAVELKVVETEPRLKGATVSGSPKPATLETGYVVNVPQFIDVGEVNKVSTTSGEYLERAKK